ETLAQWIVELNMPGAGVPTVYRNFDEPEDMKARAERDAIVKALGYEPTEEYITETYGAGWVETVPEIPAPLPTFNSDLGDVLDGDALSRPEDPAFAEAAGTQRDFNREAQDALFEASEAIAGQWQKMMTQRVDDLRSMLDETGDLVMFRERMSDLLETPP